MSDQFITLIFGSFGVFLLGQAGMLLWHLSRISTTLTHISADFDKAIRTFSDADKARQKDIDEIWEKIEDLSNGVLAVRSVQEKIK